MFKSIYNKVVKKLLAAFLSLLAAFSATPVAAQAPSFPNAVASERVPGQIIVRYKQSLPANVVELKVDGYNAKIKSRIDRINALVLNVPQDQQDAIISAFSRLPNVEFAEPDYIAHAYTATNDPSLSQQWGMSKIQASNSGGQSAWDITTGSSSVKIAILDTGINQTHEDLASKIVTNQNFTGSPTAEDNYGHGTHVAGIAAAITNNSTGVAGVGYNSALMNVKVLDDTGSGAYSWIANGIIWATDNGANVINMSLGGSSGSSTLQNAVDYATSHGVVVVAAAGNSGSSSPSYPAYYSNTIAVAATDSNDAKASWSNYGSWVDVAAPGVDIFSTMPNHVNQIGLTNYGSLSGTSMATPHVAGLAALVWATGICSTNTCVRSQIENNADSISGTGSYWTYGRINAYRSVGGGISPSPGPTPSPTPSPTPTPTPTPVPSLTMRVSDITMSYTKFSNQRTVYTKVTVLNQNNSPVSGANVSLTMTLPSGSKASGSGATGTGGTITFSLRSTQKGTYSSQVTNLTKTNYTYDIAGSITTKSLVVN
jgi:thermitase